MCCLAYSLHAGGTSGENNKHDTKYGLFLDGRMGVSNTLLKQVNTGLLVRPSPRSLPGYFMTNASLTQVHLLTNLPKGDAHAEPRVVALIMCGHKCKDDLETIGGLPFFKKLLADTNPQIA